MPVLAVILAGMLAAFTAIGHEEAAGWPLWEERWERVELAGWVLLGLVVWLGGAG